MTARQQRVIGVPLGTHTVTSSNPDENTQFRVGTVDPLVLLDEVFNSTTRAVCVYGRVGNIMLEDGTFVEGPDDMIEDCLDDEFTDEEMYALSAVLPYNTSLLAVNINGVGVTDASIVRMCQSLKNTKVRLIDLTNTVIDDETGLALLELAQENIHLRTIVVDDTLIDDALMDEIDMACLNNEATVPFLPDPPTIDPQRPRYCVLNFFGVCSDGEEYCAWLHGAPPMPKRQEEDSALKEVYQQKKSLEAVAAMAAETQKKSGLAAVLLEKRKMQQQQQQQQKQKEKEQQELQERKLKQQEEEQQQQQKKKSEAITQVANSDDSKITPKNNEIAVKVVPQKSAQEEELERLKLLKEEIEKQKREEKERKKRRKDEEESREFRHLLLKGLTVMGVSGFVAWFVLKKIVK